MLYVSSLYFYIFSVYKSRFYRVRLSSEVSNVRRSIVNNLPINVVPKPVMSLMTSVACNVPIMPGKVPNTPCVWAFNGAYSRSGKRLV